MKNPDECMQRLFSYMQKLFECMQRTFSYMQKPFAYMKKGDFDKICRGESGK
jgi:hypothetical protein